MIFDRIENDRSPQMNNMNIVVTGFFLTILGT